MYTVDYFISKFSAIPDNLWNAGEMIDKHGRHCAYGHCGVTDGDIVNDTMNEEGKALSDLFYKNGLIPHLSVIGVNDGNDKRYKQPTPKQRILAALYDIKKLQQPKREKVKAQISPDLLAPPIPKEVEKIDRPDAEIQANVLKNFYDGLKDVLGPNPNKI